MLHVARDAARKAIGQALRERMRQHGHAVCPTDRRRKHRNGIAQHVHRRIKARLHPPRRFGMDVQRHWSDATRLIDPRHQSAQCAQLGHAEELVGIHGDCGREPRPHGLKRKASQFRSTQQGHRGREREAQLLALRAAGLVDRARIDAEDMPGKTTFAEISGGAKRSCEALLRLLRRRQPTRQIADRVETEIERDLFRLKPAMTGELWQQPGKA